MAIIYIPDSLLHRILQMPDTSKQSFIKHAIEEKLASIENK